MIRATIQIQNYNPQNGYHFMEITRVDDGRIIKNTEIFPMAIAGVDDNLFQAQILHYIEPDHIDEDLIGDYVLRIYSEYGPIEEVSTFSVVKSSMPVTATQNTPEESTTPEESAKIPSWVHDIFVWYANETISESELLAALEYLISQGTINVNSD